MIVALCIDDNNGMLFNHRRQSRDQVVLDDIALVSRGKRLYMNEYSYKLFAGMHLENLVIENDFLHHAAVGEYCYIEDTTLQQFRESIEQFIIYKWNRKYPADFYFDINLLKEWRLLEKKEFIGISHNRITREIYVK